MRRLVPLLVLALAGAFAGGCSSGKVDEANTYVKAVNQAQTAFTTESDRLIRAIGPDTAENANHQVDRRLARFYAAVDRFVARLRAIKPPDRVRSLHAKLIGAMTDFGRSLRRAGAGLTSGDATRILGGQQRLQQASAAVAAAINTTIAQINAGLKS